MSRHRKPFRIKPNLITPLLIMSRSPTSVKTARPNLRSSSKPTSSFMSMVTASSVVFLLLLQNHAVFSIHYVPLPMTDLDYTYSYTLNKDVRFPSSTTRHSKQYTFGGNSSRSNYSTSIFNRDTPSDSIKSASSAHFTTSSLSSTSRNPSRFVPQVYKY
jgi:hypothetical protein